MRLLRSLAGLVVIVAGGCVPFDEESAAGTQDCTVTGCADGESCVAARCEPDGAGGGGGGAPASAWTLLAPEGAGSRRFGAVAFSPTLGGGPTLVLASPGLDDVAGGCATPGFVSLFDATTGALHATLRASDEREALGDALAVGDFDGDGTDDLALAGRVEGEPPTVDAFCPVGGSLFVVRGPIERELSLPEDAAVAWEGLPARALGTVETPRFVRRRDVAAGDVDGDGRAELLVATRNGPAGVAVVQLCRWPFGEADCADVPLDPAMIYEPGAAMLVRPAELFVADPGAPSGAGERAGLVAWLRLEGGVPPATPTAVLAGTEAGKRAGVALAADDRWITLGAPGRLAGAGRVLLFDRTLPLDAPSDVWIGAEGEQFGASLLLTGSEASTVLHVGAPGFDTASAQELGRVVTGPPSAGGWTHDLRGTTPRGRLGSALAAGIDVLGRSDARLVVAEGAGCFVGDAAGFVPAP